MDTSKRESDRLIFQDYVHSWEEKDISLFLSLLDTEISITECFGAKYDGKSESEKWFDHWNSNSLNKVTKWYILNHYYDSESDCSIFEWNFEYIYNGKPNCFTGISVVKIKNNKNSFFKGI